MDEEAAAAAATSPDSPTSATAEAVAEAPADRTRRRSSVFSDFRDRLRTSVSSRVSADRFKFLARWRSRRLSKASASSSLGPDDGRRASTPESGATCGIGGGGVVVVGAPKIAPAADEAAGSSPTNETNVPHVESQDNKSENPVENKPVPTCATSSASRAMSSLPTDSSIASLSLGPNERFNESGDVTSSFTDALNSLPNISDLSSFTSDSADDEVHSNTEDIPAVPAVIGVQLQPPTFLCIYSSSSSSARSTVTGTEESLGSESSGGTTGDISSSSSGGSVLIEPEPRIRPENELARSYYDRSVRPRIRKQLQRLDEDPPIF